MIKAVLKRLLAVIAVLVIVIAAAGGILWKLSDNSQLDTTFYRVVSDKIGDGVRIALLSDLHNNQLGEGNKNLISEIMQLDPDIILMAGDMVNDDDPDTSVVLNLCSELLKVAPVYYGFGNHEGNLVYLEGGYKVPLDVQLIELGVNVLYTDPYETEVNGNKLQIEAAAYTPESFQEDAAKTVESFEKLEGFKILVSHYPSLYYERLSDVNADLVVSGHLHGGQIRLPGGQGLYHKDTGFFPKYCYGQFWLTNAQLIVSRGLGNHNKIPRINNRPELVIIDVSHV